MEKCELLALALDVIITACLKILEMGLYREWNYTTAVEPLLSLFSGNYKCVPINEFSDKYRAPLKCSNRTYMCTENAPIKQSLSI